MKSTDATTFDHYQVLTRSDGSLHELGRGAMGITYKARDTNLQVPVALKIIHPQALHTPEARERFIREARAAAKLRHPHVASVFHLGTAGEAYFYAMEFIAGETVEALVQRRGPLAAWIALRLAIQISRALSAAETHGLVHRDLKPSNLMLLRDDQELCVKLIDFGLARGAHDVDPAGGFVGTPHFASPEQLEGHGVDARSDIYSLGATLWFLLTGHPPFRGSVAEVMRQHATAALPTVELGDAPAALRALLERLLAKEPTTRPQNALELRRELEACLPATGEGGSGAARLAQEEQEIAAETSHGAEAMPFAGFDTLTVIARRYEIVRRLGETNEGWTFRARDLETHHDVRLLLLRQNFAADPEMLARWRREVARVARVSHPHLLGLQGLESSGPAGVLVQEWTEGFTLREVLRTRSELEPAEALSLLDQMAPAVDFAAAADLPPFDLALHRIHLHFPELAGPAADLLRTPITQWPAFSVKLDPLNLRRDLAASETWAGAQTMVSSLPHAAARAGEPTYPRQLALLLYELLGGALRPALAEAHGGEDLARYVPLSSLTEEGNEVLHQAMDPATSPASGAELRQSLRAVEQLETRHQPEPPRAVAALAGLTPRPIPLPPSRPRWPRGLAWAGLAVLLAGAAVYVATRPGPTEQLVAEATPAPAAMEPPPPAATPAPVEPPPPAPDPRAQLQAAVTAAERMEENGTLSDAIGEWLGVARAFPQAEAGRMHLELLLDKVRLRQTRLSGPDLEETLPALREAAKQEVISAMLLLGDSLREGAPEESYQWFSAAAAKQIPYALLQMGLMSSNGFGTPKDFPAAAAAFEQAADQGDASAQFALAECLLAGKGVPRDEPRALELLRLSSAKGNLRAMNRLGTCYQQGIGGPKNFAEAFRLYSAAAEQGFGDAIGNLGVLYINGDGVAPSPRHAVELFQQGAAQGDGYCMYLYARCYETGTGVAASTPEARRWYVRSAEAGFPKAIEWCRQRQVALP